MSRAPASELAEPAEAAAARGAGQAAGPAFQGALALRSRSPDAHAAVLARLPDDAARRDFVRRIGRTHGNRHAARVLARRLDTAGLKKIADRALGSTYPAIEAQHLVWELIHSYCPEKGFALSGSGYEAGVTGFRLDQSFTWLGPGKGVRAGGTSIVVGDDVVKRAAGGAIEALGKELRGVLAALPDPFRQIAAVPSLAGAPTHVILPLALQEGLEAGWAKSLPGTESKEQGGILVEKGDEFTYRPGRASSSAMFTPNFGDRKKDEKLVVVAHTHPYSAKEGGHTKVSFSGGDLETMVAGPETVDVVRSGEGDFLAAVTQETQELIKKAASKPKFIAEIGKFWTSVYTAPGGGSIPDRARAATKATCLKYHLIYYEGSKGVLAQPRDMLDARAKAP